MKLLIPPPIQTLLSAIMMWLISRYFLYANFSLNGMNVLAFLFLIIGVIIIIMGINKFRENRTTISPIKPNKTSSLVNNGIYKYTRNPMYLGLLLMVVFSSSFFKEFYKFFNYTIIYIVHN